MMSLAKAMKIEQEHGREIGCKDRKVPIRAYEIWAPLLSWPPKIEMVGYYMHHNYLE